MEKISILNNFWILIPAVIWTLIWKGIALWKAAKRNELAWFIALLILNTVGILEIIYIFLISRKKETEMPSEKQAKEIIGKKII